ncbi:DUF4180 domain-containing protein [Pseudoflavitalea sp. G-6-1-2]|uniref:DUF4180 domain-containing protein n=1 Tax=Pseudoflavitalea sp. G-6-1-2 TaxID=2728841 RepID=UPI00146A2216|nr:DUF4180 domain-containing protein [Pseudoflavitalea sp. G-6-1-2]NML21246.1 DUF4180 domain-containing protein [Pseudoflavitalea sp. G-6-1-2]
MNDTQILTHQIQHLKYGEVIADTILIKNVDDGLNLMGDLYYQGFDGIILHEKNITPAFFDLKTKLAGEILQKFTNYRMKLIVLGDFSKYASKSLRDFIFETNKAKQILFLSSLEEAVQSTQ